MQPLVSIIVATYNRERLLRDTLAQLLAQDYPNYELLVVDQSQRHEPETEAYLASLAGRIRHIRLEVANLPSARNVGIRSSRGDIIAFFDDDMVLGADVVSKLVRTYDDPTVWGAAGFVIGNGCEEADKYRLYAAYVDDPRDLRRKPHVRVRTFDGCFMSFRKALFNTAGYFDEWMGTQPLAAGEDGEFCRRASYRGFGLYLNTAITVRHLQGVEGGCGRRGLAPAVVRDAELNCLVYTHLKNRRFPGAIGWLHSLCRCYRQAILNRGIFHLGPAEIIQRHRALGSSVSVNIARLRSRGHSSPASPQGPDGQPERAECGRPAGSQGYGVS